VAKGPLVERILLDKVSGSKQRKGYEDAGDAAPAAAAALGRARKALLDDGWREG